MKLPALSAFRYFDVAAETESFVRAAERLHVTHGAVSRQVRLLEESLGIDLFERRNRAIFLTPAGRALHGTTQAIFEQLEGAVQRLQQQERDNVLVLSCEPTIAMRWLIPRLPRFHAAHPDLQLHLVAAGGPVDFARSGVDLALRRDDFHWPPALHSMKICDEWIGPVSRTNSDNLDGQRLLHSSTRPNAWPTWLRLGERQAAHSERSDFEHFYLSLQAASAGLGLAIASALMVRDELDSGQLHAPFGFLRDGSAYYLLSPQPLSDGGKRQRFAEWVMNECQACLTHLGLLQNDELEPPSPPQVR
ncbi:LysR substrate-binding domain-containing protein [Pseudomonas sp. SAR267]|jgi:DNA-binding transcriptional LysR family regulator|uniref:LysR substrate-binding domain-containing protein n=1 Tax=Pseudomonas TaxID=286 RepID=UPI0006D46093|nr:MULTISPECIES: LysR substrate-binding domain-containing protein [unclassified Pseudomonas]AXQ46750.1 LysR family transcriptional regulator [Stenotrophomonas rhizophila]MBS3188476.1 LysR family transcriptional regulator [Pseudomonas sp. PCH44]PIK77305.1 LysR family transcriptional regulator [Pseudomonas sp. 382]HCV38394.1 LysR family transcriptional regulator [Pseudomonas sp.]